MIDTEGHILPLEYIRNTLQLKCDFLLHNRLKNRIQTILGKSQISIQDNIKPRSPIILYIIEAGVMGNKNTYFNLVTTGNNIPTYLKGKWSEKLNDDIRLDTLSIFFRMQKNILLQFTNILFNISYSIGE